MQIASSFVCGFRSTCHYYLNEGIEKELSSLLGQMAKLKIFPDLPVQQKIWIAVHLGGCFAF